MTSNALTKAPSGPKTYMVTAVSNLSSQGGGAQSPTNFSITFARGLDLSVGSWSVGLVDLQIFNTLYNIGPAYKNQEFLWTTPTSLTPDVPTPVAYTGAIPAGNYSATAIVTAVDDILMRTTYPNDISGTGAVANIGLSINYPRLTFQVDIGATGYGFNPSNGGTSNLYQNLGASNNTLYNDPDTLYVFPNQADISNGIGAWQVRCNVTGSSFSQGVNSNILFTFVPAVAAGGLYSIQPAFPLFQSVNQTSISQISFLITDQLGRQLDLNPGTAPGGGIGSNNPTTIVLMFRRDD
jgi:hypothetical protein